MGLFIHIPNLFIPQWFVNYTNAPRPTHEVICGTQDRKIISNDDGWIMSSMTSPVTPQTIKEA